MSQELDEALELLDRVKGSHRSMPERKRLSVELAALLQRAALQGMTQEEKKAQEQLSRLMQDPVGKAFTTAMTDECFRSHSHLRTADQMNHLLSQFRVPSYLDWFQKLELLVFKSLPSTNCAKRRVVSFCQKSQPLWKNTFSNEKSKVFGLISII